VREQQINQLKKLRASRDEVALKRSIRALEDAAKNPPSDSKGEKQNLLALMVEAARAQATVGEMSDALETGFGRHVAEIRSIQGVYRRELSGKAVGDNVKNLDQMISRFEKNEGRRPRILVAKMGQDGHDRGQKVIASAPADFEALTEAGAAAIFPPGTIISDAAIDLLTKLNKALGFTDAA